MNKIPIDKHLVLRSRARTLEPHRPSINPGALTPWLGERQWKNPTTEGRFFLYKMRLLIIATA